MDLIRTLPKLEVYTKQIFNAHGKKMQISFHFSSIFINAFFGSFISFAAIVGTFDVALLPI